MWLYTLVCTCPASDVWLKQNVSASVAGLTSPAAPCLANVYDLDLRPNLVSGPSLGRQTAGKFAVNLHCFVLAM